MWLPFLLSSIYLFLLLQKRRNAASHASHRRKYSHRCPHSISSMFLSHLSPVLVVTQPSELRVSKVIGICQFREIRFAPGPLLRPIQSHIGNYSLQLHRRIDTASGVSEYLGIAPRLCATVQPRKGQAPMAWVHVFLFKCPKCSRPQATASTSHRSSLEEEDAQLFDRSCECGWSGALLGLVAVKHWVVAWEIS